jgi:hypothetical protein
MIFFKYLIQLISIQCIITSFKNRKILQVSADVSKRKIETAAEVTYNSFSKHELRHDERGLFFQESRAYEALYHHHITSFESNYFICNDSNFVNVLACGHPGVKD